VTAEQGPAEPEPSRVEPVDAGQQRSMLSREERLRFGRKAFFWPIALFVAVYALWVALTVFAVRLGGARGAAVAVVDGLVIGLLFVVGHDACHNSYTPSTPLNRWIGRLAFLPSLVSFSLWYREHNQVHHRYNNVRHFDHVWEPLSTDEYVQRGLLGRALYRFYRSPIGVMFYYAFEPWRGRLVVPRRKFVGTTTREQRWDAMLLFAFLVCEAAAAIGLGLTAARGPVESVALGVVVPFAVWCATVSFVIYLHHTHPSVLWYPDIPTWRAQNGAATGTLHMVFPWPLGALLLNIMQHPAHHVAPGVPLYSLPSLERLVEERAPVLRLSWSFRQYLDTCRVCKLYDYDAGRWEDFSRANRMLRAAADTRAGGRVGSGAV
jgi:omega-6 fatty acid desaturase (delta-12 desaturase)